MEVTKIDLYEYFGLTRPEKGSGYLNIYTHFNEFASYGVKKNRPAMLVVAGGGYSGVSHREKEVVAMAYMAKGFNCFTLEYSVVPVKHPAQLIEACMAMAYIRENAETLSIVSNRVAAVGFSAGGHLCSMLGTISDDKVVIDALGEKAKLCKPDAVVLAYPVITSGEFAHVGSFSNLCGEDEDLRASLSTETRVDKNSSPAFIWATVTDQVVPCENSFLMAMAYRKAGVPFELHVYDKGPHGMSLADLDASVGGEDDSHVCAHVASWLNLSVEWLVRLGIKLTVNE